jgi:hypothetical protein
MVVILAQALHMDEYTVFFKCITVFVAIAYTLAEFGSWCKTLHTSQIGHNLEINISLLCQNETLQSKPNNPFSK